MAAISFDVAVVGHFSVDTLVLPTRKQPFQVLGGSATYTSFAAKHLESSVSVISKVGENFPEAYLRQIGPGCIRYDDTAPGGGRDIHPVHPHPVTRNHFQPLGRFQRRCINLIQTGNETVGVCN